MREPVGASPTPVETRTPASAPRQGRGRTPAAVWVLMAAFALLSAVWSVLTPPLLAPDERSHFSSVVRLIDGFSWPDPGQARIPNAVVDIGGERSIPGYQRSTLSGLEAALPGDSAELDQMTQHPPLYYLIAGKLIALVGAEDGRWDRALLIVRLLGAPIGAAVVWFAWASVHTLTRSRKAGIVAAATVFLVPGFAQMVGVTNNDTLAIFFGALITWLSVKVLGGERSWPVLVGLGAAVGVAGLAKGTLIAFGPLVVLALLFGRGHPPTWPRRLWQTVWPLLIALALGQWWWLRNLFLFGTLQPYGYLLSDKTWEAGGGPDVRDFADELWRVTPTTFWGWFGRVNAPLPQFFVDVLTIGCLGLVVVGLCLTRKKLLTIVALVSPTAVSAILLIRVSWGAYADTSDFRGMHGRYFYPVLVLGISLAAIATMRLLRDEASRRRFGIGAIVLSGFMSLYGLAIAYTFFYADDDWNKWIDGIRRWIVDMSPAPPWLTVLTPALFLSVFAAGLVLAVREVRSASHVAAARSSVESPR